MFTEVETSRFTQEKIDRFETQNIIITTSIFFHQRLTNDIPDFNVSCDCYVRLMEDGEIVETETYTLDRLPRPIEMEMLVSEAVDKWHTLYFGIDEDEDEEEAPCKYISQMERDWHEDRHEAEIMGW